LSTTVNEALETRGKRRHNGEEGKKGKPTSRKVCFPVCDCTSSGVFVGSRAGHIEKTSRRASHGWGERRDARGGKKARRGTSTGRVQDAKDGDSPPTHQK